MTRSLESLTQKWGRSQILVPSLVRGGVNYDLAFWHRFRGNREEGGG